MSKQTIYGVPRAAIMTLLSEPRPDAPNCVLEARAVLCALLDAPPLEPDPIVAVLKGNLSSGTQPTFSGGDLKHLIGILERAPSAQPQGEPVYMVRTHGSCCWEEVGSGSLEDFQSMPEEYELRALYTRPAEQPAQATITLGEKNLGNILAAYDGPSARRAYSYTFQPGNVVAATLGNAWLAASKGGDSIDAGLSLLERLEQAGYGVFAI